MKYLLIIMTEKYFLIMEFKYKTEIRYLIKQTTGLFRIKYS